ncbi:zona pellucida-binding protein 1 isoform X2 [Tachyglossus aculeatus]|uniref:zona pellucida-binding protein 1 isoform X2 n=1 Tax=Tachyglossus aculeatus TaxID=9261 RepID=UPI0018F3AFF6|nr:zona pellucida-binding protein 1 isoform X2 [Tachyglossus aculeatus]
MAGSSPGGSRRLWGRGRSRALGPAFLLSLLVSVLQAPPTVEYQGRVNSADSEPELLKVTGSTIFPVKVYVQLDHASPHILCVTNRLRNAELIDPLFLWHGPRGDLVAGNNSIKITPTGTLSFKDFKEPMSGVYTCSLEYKPTAEQSEKTLLLKYIIYAYAEPNFYYQFSARYHSAPCNSIYNVSFEKKLLQILSKLVADLSCEIALLKSDCHHVKMQRAGLQNELFFTFSVSSLESVKRKDPCAMKSCDTAKRLGKAKNLIERFFNQQVEVLGKRTDPLPEIYYIEGTLKMVWINRCYPGYGINIQLHPNCPDCCVICSPGTFNPQDGVHCLQCNNSSIFGARDC